MAQRILRPVTTSKHDAVLLYAKLTGGGAASNLVVADGSGQVPSEVVTATYSSTGVFTIVFRYKYPRLLGAPDFSFVGTTAGLAGACTAFDPTAGTATFKFTVGNTATDPATTDTIYINWTVSNSGGIVQ